MVTAFRSGTLGLIQNLLAGGAFAELSDACLLDRFATRRDEAAFAALVMRHGAMVLNTCRAVLKDSNASDDAFQATFVLLFRKAATIRGRDALGCWLHRVAYRVAVQAASDEARRRDVEKTAGSLRGLEASSQDDRNAILHEEIERLPERFRLPLVLCDLEGLTRDQAATRLGLTEGSVRGRLAKGRKLLGSRLTRRGISPTLPLAVPGSIPETLVASTAKLAGSGASVAVEALVKAFSKGVALARTKMLAASLLAVGSMAVALVVRGTFAEPPAKPGAANPPASPVQVAVQDDAKKTNIEGRILDLEGRPILGATISLDDAEAAPEGQFDAWVDDIKRFNKQNFGQQLVAFSGQFPDRPERPSAKTSADGRFRIEGVPRDGVVTLSLTGPGIETASLVVLTREMPTIRVKDPNSVDGRFSVYYGLKFDHAAAPSRMITGTIRDKDSGAPIAGVRITGMPNIPNSMVPTPGVEAISDAQGRYQVSGLPASQGFKLFTEVPNRLPYVNYAFVMSANDPKAGPLTYDLNLKRGVLVRGRLTDKATGQAVRGAVDYFAFLRNANLDEYANFTHSQLTRVMTDLDGRFTLPALPGRGLVAARAQIRQYLQSVNAESIEGFDKQRGWFATYPQVCMKGNHEVYAEINPEPGTAEVTLELQADPGRTIRGTVVDPDGRAIQDGVEIRTLDVFHSPTETDQPVFEVTGLPPGPYRLDFFHKARKLAGSIALKGDEKDDVVVKLQPWGTVVGRVVDEAGQPRLDVELFSTIRGTPDPESGDLETKPTVDAQGRFRIEGLVPGVKYDALGRSSNKTTGPILKGVKVEAGEVKDLGDVVLPTVRAKGKN